MSEILGFISAVLIGMSLGLIGSGGSILTVPVLVYFFNIEPVLATAYSLFIVGVTALAGTAKYMRENLLNYKMVLLFSLPALLGVFLARIFILPMIPNVIVLYSSYEMTKGTFILLLFSVLMLLSAVSMIRNGKKEASEEEEKALNYPLISAEGFGVGILTGLVGAGGGFLIIPALVLLAKIPMKMAVGTSLLIIAIKSLAGFTGDIGSGQPINWLFLAEVSLVAVGGIFIGSYLSKRISGKRLKPAFGWFVLLMGIYIIIKEIS